MSTGPAHAMSDADMVSTSPAPVFADPLAGHPIPRISLEPCPNFVRHRPVSPAEYAAHYKGSGIPIVIDLGASECRAGYATDAEPRVIIPTAIFPTRWRGVNPQYLFAGRHAGDSDPAKQKSKSPFDGNAVNGVNWLEIMLDYVFEALGLAESDSVAHPIVVTEPLNSPAFSRAIFSELLFGAYRVPAVCYVVDMLCSWVYNTQILPPLAPLVTPPPGKASLVAAAAAEAAWGSAAADAARLLQSPSKRSRPAPSSGASSCLIVSLSHSSMHILPVYRGKPVFASATRIPFGAASLHAHFAALLEAKFPFTRHFATVPRARWLVETCCAVAPSAGVYVREMQHIVRVCAPAWARGLGGAAGQEWEWQQHQEQEEAAAAAAAAALTGNANSNSNAVATAVSPTGSTLAADGSASTSAAGASASHVSTPPPLPPAASLVGFVDRVAATAPVPTPVPASEAIAGGACVVPIHLALHSSALPAFTAPFTSSLSQSSEQSADGPLPFSGPLAIVNVPTSAPATAAAASTGGVATEEEQEQQQQRKIQSSIRFRKLLLARRVAKLTTLQQHKAALEAGLAAFDAAAGDLAAQNAAEGSLLSAIKDAGYVVGSGTGAVAAARVTLSTVATDIATTEASIATAEEKLKAKERDQQQMLSGGSIAGAGDDDEEEEEEEAEASGLSPATGSGTNDAAAAAAATAAAATAAQFMGYTAAQIAERFPLLLVPDSQLDAEGQRDKKKQKFLKVVSEGRLRKDSERTASAAVVAAALAGGEHGLGGSTPVDLAAAKGFYEAITVLTMQSTAATVLGSSDSGMTHRAKIIEMLKKYDMRWPVPPSVPAPSHFLPPSFAGAAAAASAATAAAAPPPGVWAQAHPTMQAAVRAVKGMDAVLTSLWKVEPGQLTPIPFPAVITREAALATAAATAAASAAAAAAAAAAGGNGIPGEESASAAAEMAALFDPARPSSVVAAELGLLPSDLMLWGERLQVPEALFTPALAGARHAGLGEAALRVLRGMAKEEARECVRNVFVAGGLGALPWLPARIASELSSADALTDMGKRGGAGGKKRSKGEMKQDESDDDDVGEGNDGITVVRARDPVLDAWKGARDLTFRAFSADKAAFLREWCVERSIWAAGEVPIHAVRETPVSNVFVDVVHGLACSSSNSVADD